MKFPVTHAVIVSVAFVNTPVSISILRETYQASSHGRPFEVDPEAVVEEQWKTFQRSINRTKEDVETIEDAPSKIKRDFFRVMAIVMPGFSFEPLVLLSAFMTVFFSLLWFVLYHRYCYKTVDDRLEQADRWKVGRRLAREAWESDPDQRGISGECTPEIIMQFHHPAYGRKEGQIEIPVSALDSILVGAQEEHLDDTQPRFRHLAALRNDRSLTGTPRPRLSTVAFLGAATNGHFSSAIGLAGKTVNLDQARVALLKDIYQFLPTLGFTLDVFSSVDNDALFVCVSLERHEVVQHYLERDDVCLPVRPDMAEKLNIKQPEEEPASSPPFLLYDSRTQTNLMAKGVIDDDDAVGEVYKLPYFKSRGLLSGMDSIRVIFNELNTFIDVEKAVECGLMVSWFPVHNKKEVDELNINWANWRLLADLSFAQPTTHIREYFGERVAFLFAWTGTYCKLLLPLTVAALIHVFVQWATQVHQVIGFTIVLGLWSRIVSNLWDRDQSFFIELWNINDRSETMIRAKFFGYDCVSEVDFNDTRPVKRYPKEKYYARQFLSNLIVFFCCCVVLGAQVCWRKVFHHQLTTVSSIILALNIKVFEIVFNAIVPSLTDFENHMSPDKHYNSYLWKQAFYQGINQFSPFIFLTLEYAVIMSRSGCVDSECLAPLQKALPIAMLVLTACSLGQTLVYSLLVRYSLWFENFKMNWKQQGEAKRYYIEEQAKFVDFGIREEIETMLMPVIALGHVLIFSAVAPVAVPFAFIVFAVQLRALAKLLTGAAKRVLPMSQRGIGAYHRAVRMLMQIGVFYSGFLFVIYGLAFKGAAVITKLTGFVLFFILMYYAGWGLVDFVVPSKDKERVLLQARRRHLLRKIQLTVEGSPEVQMNDDDWQHRAQKARDIEQGEWDNIMKLHEAWISSTEFAPSPMYGGRAPSEVTMGFASRDLGETDEESQ